MLGSLLSWPVRVVNAPLKIADAVVEATIDEDCDLKLSDALEQLAEAIEEEVDE